jgi:hypothetical protein
MALAGARFVTIGSDVANFRIHEGSITGSGRLNEKYRVDCDRLFEKTFGRKKVARDALTGALARLAKWVVDPAYLVRRLTRLRVSG